MQANVANAEGELRLETPPGWKVEPSTQSFKIATSGEQEVLTFQVTPPAGEHELTQWPHLVMALGGGFLIGLLLRIGPWKWSSWYQDVLAWLSLLAMLFLIVEVVMHVIINPGTSESATGLLWESLVVGMVACYFGARS